MKTTEVRGPLLLSGMDPSCQDCKLFYVAYIEREDGMMRIGFSAQAEALTNFVDATGYTLSELITAIERDVKSAIAVSLDKETFEEWPHEIPQP